MKFSVWHPSTRRYEYYEAQGDTGIHAGAPPRVSTTEIGATPEQAAWPLPSGAVKVGSGEMPIGRIASLGGGEFSIDIPQSIMYAAIGYLIWRVLR